MSRLDYCNAVLADLPASTLAPFQRVLHAAAAARTVLDRATVCDPGSPRVAQVTSRREDPVQVVPDVPQVAAWTHARVHVGLTVAAVPARSALRASSSGDLVVPRTRRRIGDRAFSVAAPRAWNTLPTQLKLLRLTTNFCQLKTFLFQSTTGKETDDCFVMRPWSSVGGAIQMTQLQLRYDTL